MINSAGKEIKNGGTNLISELEEKIERYARVSHYVLITGERGTGKTTIARELHRQSSRASREFVNLNCASLTQELLESELFGYEKGAFTGASAPKAGLFEIANGGTLFLDEIGEIDVSLQAKLLKAVEEKRIRRVGGSAERPVDTRIVAATSQNLRQMAAEGRFRADLYDRLNILNLETVPLRHQRERIREILLRQLGQERHAVGRERPFEVCEKAFGFLENCKWKGNFRELLNLATRLSVECSEAEIITAEHVRRVMCTESDYFAAAENKGTLKEEKGTSEYRPDNLVTVTFDAGLDDLGSIYVKAAGTMIRHVLSQNNGNLRKSARALGATHSTLSRILKKYHETCESQDFSMPAKTVSSFAVAS